jgi:hypothetical protein
MSSILKQPFPRNHSFRKKIFNALLSGLIVTLFLRIFSPFEIARTPVENLNWFIVGYGIITSIVVFIFALFEKLVPAIFEEERWTIGKNILLYLIIIFMIGCVNLIYTSVVAGLPISFETFLTFQLFTLSVTFIVVASTTMFRYFSSLDFYKKKAKIIEEEIQHLKPSTENQQLENQFVSIISENEKENFQLKLEDLYYIEAADNYSKIVFRKDKRIMNTLIRSSLKRLESQFTQKELLRCHRTYIVQLRNIERVSGNSQGYRLHFKDVPESVPVSRNSSQELHNRISQLSSFN